MIRRTRLKNGSASGRRYRYRAGSWRRTAAGGRVSVTDSTTRRPSRSSERGSPHAHAHRAGMFRVAQHWPLRAGGPRPRGQRDEQRLLDGAELGLVSVSHPVHETPRAADPGRGGGYR